MGLLDGLVGVRSGSAALRIGDETVGVVPADGHAAPGETGGNAASPPAARR